MYYYCSETVPQHRILFILLLELREFIRRLHGFEPEFTWDTGVEVEDRLLWDFTVASLLHHGLLASSPSYPGMLLTGALSVYIPRQHSCQPGSSDFALLDGARSKLFPSRPPLVPTPYTLLLVLRGPPPFSRRATQPRTTSSSTWKHPGDDRLPCCSATVTSYSDQCFSYKIVIKVVFFFRCFTSDRHPGR